MMNQGKFSRDLAADLWRHCKDVGITIRAQAEGTEVRIYVKREHYDRWFAVCQRFSKSWLKTRGISGDSGKKARKA